MEKKTAINKTWQQLQYIEAIYYSQTIYSNVKTFPLKTLSFLCEKFKTVVWKFDEFKTIAFCWMNLILLFCVG